MFKLVGKMSSKIYICCGMVDGRYEIIDSNFTGIADCYKIDRQNPIQTRSNCCDRLRFLHQEISQIVEKNLPYIAESYTIDALWDDVLSDE
jgi:hypothetical protein